jgi:DNA polymerase family A
MSQHPISVSALRGEHYIAAPWFCLDFETTNIRNGDARIPENRIVCVAWQVNKGDALGKVKSFYGDLFDAVEFWQDLRAVAEAGGYAVAQQCKFEAHWLLRHEYDAPGILWGDPLLFEWVLLGNNPDGLSLSLDELAARYCPELRKEPFIDALMQGGTCPSEMPAHLLLARCERDVYSTAVIARRQIATLARRGQLHLAALRCMLAPILAHIERQGIALDGERVRAKHAEYTTKYLELKEALDGMTGGINERSPNEMVPFVYGLWPTNATEEDKARIKPLGFRELTNARGTPKRGKATKSWPDGRPKLNKNVLAVLERKATTERQREWVQIRKAIGQAYAALSKNLDFYLGIVTERGGWWYGNILQGIVATHRLSGTGMPQEFAMFGGDSKSCQPQNQPREFKGLVTARRPKHKASDADAKQLEFRVAAMLGQDAKAMADIRDADFDAHIQTLTTMLDGEYTRARYLELLTRYRAGDAEVKWQRNDGATCKSHTYKPLFGGEYGTEREEAYYRWFREHYSGITAECTRWLRQVEATGELRCATGLIFRWRVSFDQRSGESIDTRSGKKLKPSVFNYPVQHLAGEIMVLADVCLFYLLRQQNVRAAIVNLVHDSTPAEVHEDDREPWCQAVAQAFTVETKYYLREVYGIDFNVPLGCEVTVGDHLGEGDHFAADN